MIGDLVRKRSFHGLAAVLVRSRNRRGALLDNGPAGAGPVLRAVDAVALSTARQRPAASRQTWSTAPSPYWSVLLRRILTSAEPSRWNARSSTSRPDTSETRSRAWEATPTSAASRTPRASPLASAHSLMLSASSQSRAPA